MSRRTVKNYPSPRLMETIGATNQSAAEAIGELVANSFDARVDQCKLDIVIDLRNKEIAVIDDGKGMTDVVLEKAVCIAEDMSRYMERGEGAKGHFGMGFKTSCATLGRYYEIYTRPLEEEREYHVAFDIAEYSERPSGADAWDVVIEDEQPDTSGPLKNAAHGTAFVIKQLRDKDISADAVLDYLGNAFKAHLEQGDKITIITPLGETPAKPKPYDLIPGSKIEIDTSFGPEGEYHISGWMGLSSQTHNDGLYGFNIYRNKQLVETWNKTWFQPHLMTSRVVGEVDMDFLDATFYKQGLQQQELWELSQAHMKEYLRPLVSASRHLSRQQNAKKPKVVKETIDQMRSSFGASPYQGSSQVSDEGAEGKKRRDGAEPHGLKESVKAIVREESLVLPDEGEITITCMEKSLGGNVRAPFDYIFEAAYEEGQHSELQVIVFEDHPLWKGRADKELSKILATSDAIYRVLVEKLDIDSSKALNIRNEWINRRTAGKEGKHGQG